MSESVYKVIEVIGTSTESWEKAATLALMTAAKKVRDLRVGEVVTMDVHLDGQTLVYRTKLGMAMRATAQKAAYALEAGLPAGAIAGAAYWWACRGADRVVHTAQHQHGGTGADTSYPIHRFFLAAKQLSMLLGGAAPALERIGRELAAGRVRPLTLEAMP